jgi:fructan beta-fructosidase
VQNDNFSYSPSLLGEGLGRGKKINYAIIPKINTMKKSIQHLFRLFLICALISSCNNKKAINKADISDVKGYYTEQYRPQFHFSPEAHWMNDPNGMVYLDGEYHLFYQYYPDSTVWGPMHWGHAVSTDLVHWKHLPIALYPDSLGYIFSGSAVADSKNTSGLGSADNPAIVAIFTYHNPVLERSGSKVFQNQGIAYSTDKGRTWTKFKGNPVLKNPGITDFRDPKVFWHEETGKWIMILAVKDRIHLYSSPNLISWKFESEFGIGIGAHGGVWECPDLFKLKVEGSDVSKWVMFVSINPGGPNGGSATQYFTGDFDGHKFVPESINEKWVDRGCDNYAGVTWSNIPSSDGRRIFMGWMSNWDYATIVPTVVWRSATTIPRELSLINSDNQHLLVSNPVKEIEMLRNGSVKTVTAGQQISGEKILTTDSLNLMQCELNIDLNLAASKADSVGIIFENQRGEKFIVGYSAVSKKIYIVRGANGESVFAKRFKGVSEAAFTPGSILKLHLLIDAGSAELFVGDGKLVMTTLIFPSENFTILKAFSKGGDITIDRSEFYNLKSIWRLK